MALAFAHFDKGVVSVDACGSGDRVYADLKNITPELTEFFKPCSQLAQSARPKRADYFTYNGIKMTEQQVATAILTERRERLLKWHREIKSGALGSHQSEFIL